VLESGVVTETREPRDRVLRELTRLFELRRRMDEPPTRDLRQHRKRMIGGRRTASWLSRCA